MVFRQLNLIHAENDGVFITRVKIGDHFFTVIVDTGSSHLVVPCLDCPCGDTHDRYPLQNQESFPDFETCFAEGSCLSGVTVSNSTLCFSRDVCFEGTFGCANEYPSAFMYQEADGILGLSPGSEIVQHFPILEFCFRSELETLQLSNSTLGLKLENHTTVSILDDNAPYTVMVERIGIEDTPNPIVANFKALVDTGTSYTYLEPEAFLFLQQEYSQMVVGKNITLDPEGTSKEDRATSIGCISTDDISLVPPLRLEFSGDSHLDFEVSDYMYSADPDISCVGIFKSPSDLSILGVNFLRGRHIVFDTLEKNVLWSVCDDKVDEVAVTPLTLPPTLPATEYPTETLEETLEELYSPSP
ncbi:MAG: pepsin-like aspartic protease, partial [Promethearchaeota archaeon]